MLFRSLIGALHQVASVLRSVAQVILAALEAVANAVLSYITQFMDAIVSPLTAAIDAFANAVSEGLSSFFSAEYNFSQGSSLASTFASVFGPFASISGMVTDIEPIREGLTVAGTVLGPVLQLFNPSTLITAIGKVFGFAGGSNLVAWAQRGVEGLAGQISGFVFNTTAAILNGVGVGTQTVTPPAGTHVPQTATLASTMSTYKSTTGDAFLPNLVSPVLAATPSYESIEQYAQIAMDIGLVGLATFNVATTLLTNYLVASGFAEWFAEAFGTTLLLKIPYSALIFQVAGLALDIVAMKLSGWASIVTALVGIGLIVYPYIDENYLGWLFEYSPGAPPIWDIETLTDGVGVAVGVYDIGHAAGDW